MKNLLIIFKMFLFPFFFILFSTSVYAVELANEQFTTSANGYTSVEDSSRVYWVANDYNGDSGGYMFHDNRAWGEKEYNFGPTYSDQTLDVELRWCATSEWDPNADFLRIIVNGTTVEEDNDGGGCQTISFTADADVNGDFTIRFDPRSDSNDENAYIDWFTIDGTPISNCINSASPFSSLADASSVTTAGLYCFDLTGTTFSTYVDATGYVLAAIDFGDGSGTLPGTTELTDSSRGILNTTILSKLTETSTIRISSSNALIDVITTDATLISRVLNNETLKRGQSDNAINKGWTGTNAAVITTDASCDQTASGLNNRIIHQCGYGGGFHWIPETGHQRIVWTDGDISNSESFRLWVTTSSSSADLALSKPTPPSPLTANTNENITFLPHLENNGPDTASADITLDITYSLDVNISSVPTGYTCTVSSGTLTAGTANVCTSTSDMAASTAVDIMFTVQAIEGGALTQTITVSSASSDPDTSNNTLTSDTVTITVPLSAEDDSFTTVVNTAVTGNLFANDSGIGYSIVAADTTGLQGVITSYDVNTGIFTFMPATDFTGTTSFTYTISDDGGTTISQATVTIIVTTIPVVAVDDAYDTNPGVSIRDNLLINDVGVGIYYTSTTLAPALGTVVIQPDGSFTYTPNTGVDGTDTFTYEITDGTTTDTAVVTITIGTSFTSGNSAPWQLVNPDYSRNVIGDYKIAGNTVLCLTGNTTTHGGTCTDDQWVTSNIRISKYIDIDSDSGTWNSTSSYIDLSNTAYQASRGIVWAGLFWGGRISSSNTYPIRYAYPNGSNAFLYNDVGLNGNSWDSVVSTIGTQDIKLKVDNGSYNDILSSKFHTSGQTYAAYADVTSVVQAASLTKGKHVFTVANLTTMEGREGSPGAFGGWSLVVIYAESYTDGKPRNISIYNGFLDIGDNDDPVEISGFKLPTGGDVLANLSVFSGEGEYLYGRNSDNVQTTAVDWMKIGNTATYSDANYQYMPGMPDNNLIGNRDNMFDAQMEGILRDTVAGEYNNLTNNNVGVEVDNYDVSSIMTAYRDNDPDINSIFIKLYSTQDYITPSMMAFSAELYVPELCYDYTLDIAGHVIPSVNNEIDTPFGGFNEPLTTSLYLKSLEGDIPLSNVNVNYKISNISQLTYNLCPTDTTWVSETGQYDYVDACGFVFDDNSSGFSMYIGDGKTTSQGGTISALEQRYIKFDSDLHTDNVDTDFEFSVNYTVDYGSGAVPLRQIFTADDLCDPTTTGFLPELGTFNIVDASNDHDEWNLYTQVAKRPFNLKLYAYDFDANDYLNAMPADADLNLTVEVEVIRADNFNRDANTACNDEHSQMPDVPSKFLNFTNDGNGEMVEFGYAADELDFAYRSLAMRIWYLTDINGTGQILDNHNCTRDNQSECIVLYGSQYTSDTSCQNECRDIASSGNCYDCLRTNYGRKVCSRDNFAVRPESFITQIYDSNQSNDTRVTSNHIANSTTTSSEFSLIAGYDYRFDINATNHVDDIATPRYIQHFEPGSATHYIHMNWHPNGHTVTGCNDVSDKNISLNIFNGSDVNPITHLTYVDKVDQIGKYQFEVYDQNWTSADWDTAQMQHHTTAPYADYYIDGSDCLPNQSIVNQTGVDGKHGCTTSSVHTNADTGTEYKYLYAQYYPYTFATNLSIGARPTNDGANAAFVYINTPNLNLYPDGVDENMSYNVQGTFTAVGKDNINVSNFVDNCYAESVDMELHQNYNHALPSQTTELSYDLINYDTVNGIVSRSRENGLLSNTTSSTLPIVLAQGPENFLKDMNASLNMDLGYNYVRAINTPLNPRSMQMSDFNITYSTQPATVYVDLVDDYKIYGHIDVDQNVTFVYGKARASQFFYDDITTNSVVTPISAEVYCDMGFTNCQDRGIPLMGAQTNDANWWKSINHNNVSAQDGNIVLSIPTTGSFTSGTVQTVSASIDISDAGTDNAITVFYKNGGLPITIPIDLVVNDPTTAAPSNYTDRWLIYNPYSATAAPSPFYKVRFIGTSVWTGVGQTGNVVGTGASTKKSKRMDW